jgi:hypothetical protein
MKHEHAQNFTALTPKVIQEELDETKVKIGSRWNLA